MHTLKIGKHPYRVLLSLLSSGLNICTRDRFTQYAALGFFLLISHLNVYSQEMSEDEFKTKPVSIEEVTRALGQDTVMFYYNSRYQLVKPGCAEYYRVSRVDTALATFKGDIVDYNMDGAIRLIGHYRKGRKEGLFILYYDNGQVAHKGHYKKNKPMGEWFFWYENGDSMQSLNFTESFVEVIEFWNEKGQKMVDKGNGRWYRYGGSSHFLKISGAIVNGRQHGRWKKVINKTGNILNVEKYKNGQFISGKEESRLGVAEEYTDTSFCDIYIPYDYERADFFEVNRCYPSMKSSINSTYEPAQSQGGYEWLQKTILSRFVVPGYAAGVRGEIIIQFDVDEFGKLKNFVKISNLGSGLENELIRVLQTMDDWLPATKGGKAVSSKETVRLEIM